MKIGILTYYGDLNCGTNLQAYATLRAVRQAYPNDEVEIIPFHGFKQRFLPYKTFSPVNLYHDFFRFKKYANFKKVNLGVEKDVVIKDVDEALRYIADRNYDVIYVGADTLLELDRLPKGFDGLSAYWLKDIKAKKVLIAASAKNVTFEKLTSRQKEEMAIAAQQFDSIGIRDRATFKLFATALGDDSRIHYVPDPTFTLDIDYSFIEAYLKKRKVTIPEKSVFVQFFGDDYWLNDAIKEVKAAGYTIVTNRGVSWSDIVLIDMSPLEQLGLYKKVSFAVTHRFHDGVFCMKNHTPVLIYVKSMNTFMTDEGESKHVSLLKDFGLYPQAFLGAVDSKDGLKGIMKSYEEVMKVYDVDKIESKLIENKIKYKNYLESTIKN